MSDREANPFSDDYLKAIRKDLKGLTPVTCVQEFETYRRFLDTIDERKAELKKRDKLYAIDEKAFDKKVKLVKKYKTALECIEDISTNAGFARTTIHHENDLPIKVKSDKDMDLIYEFAHVAVGRCNANHKDWQKRLDEYHKALKPAGDDNNA